MVTASRDWVCIRPATYESEIEAAILKRLFRTRSGELENTVFALLDPNGKRITRGGRSPSFVFADAADMATEMLRIAKDFKPKKVARDLPTIADVRLGLNVAACDNVPLVVAWAKNAKGLPALRAKLAQAAWDTGIVGRAHYVIAHETEGQVGVSEVAEFEGKLGVYVVVPDAYGLEGRVLEYLSSKKELAAGLREALGRYEPVTKNDRRHVREGKRKGLDWESELPVTGPQERRRR